MDKTEEHYLIYGGAGLAALVIAFALLKGNSSAAQPGTVAPPSPQLLSFLTTNEENATTAATAKANLAAQSLLQYQNNANALELGLSSIKAQSLNDQMNATTAEEIARIQSDAATQAAQLGFTAAQSIAAQQTMAAIQTAKANAQATTSAADAAAHASQQNGLYSAIANIVGSVAKFIP